MAEVEQKFLDVKHKREKLRVLMSQKFDEVEGESEKELKNLMEVKEKEENFPEGSEEGKRIQKEMKAKETSINYLTSVLRSMYHDSRYK